MTDQELGYLIFIVIGIAVSVGAWKLFYTPLSEVDETERKKKLLGDNYNQMIDTQRLNLHPVFRVGIEDKIVFNKSKNTKHSNGSGRKG